MDSFWELAGGDRLKKYGEWILLDKIAKMYSYSHDEAFALSWSEAMTIICYNRESAYVENKCNEIKRSISKKN